MISGVGTKLSLRSLPAQTILGFYDYIHLPDLQNRDSIAQIKITEFTADSFRHQQSLVSVGSSDSPSKTRPSRG